MRDAVLSLRVLGENEAIRGKVVERRSNTSSSSDYREEKDLLSSHKSPSGLGERNLGLVSCDKSCSRIN